MRSMRQTIQQSNFKQNPLSFIEAQLAKTPKKWLILTAKLQPLAAEIAWTKNTLILDRCQNLLQRVFYLRAGILLGPSANQAETVVCPSWRSLGQKKYSIDGIFCWSYIPE